MSCIAREKTGFSFRKTVTTRQGRRRPGQQDGLKPGGKKDRPRSEATWIE